MDKITQAAQAKYPHSDPQDFGAYEYNRNLYGCRSAFKHGAKWGIMEFDAWLNDKGYYRSTGMDVYYCGNDTYKTTAQLFELFKNEKP